MNKMEFQNEEGEYFKFFGLGGCNEVGRSCHIIEYKEKVIMLDAGVHPALSGHGSFPFYDEYDLAKVDILLISHFHLDHAASLPYLMQHTRFQGQVFMTHATKAIYRWLLQDFVRVTSIGNNFLKVENETSNNLYTDEDIISSFEKIETIDYHSTHEVKGIRFTAYHAGHVLGACMYFIEIGGLKILFTGDYSREENRHLISAEIPEMKPDILITESTFGTGILEPRLELENRFTKVVHSTIAAGGRVLIPVFALGNAQELLLILEEYWSLHEELQNVNIYYASSLAKRCMAVYQTYTNIMNDKIRLNSSKDGSKKNPFDFKYVRFIKNLFKLQDFGPSVVVASPGMLQAGFSRQLLEKWASNPKNIIIITGYSVEGTMAKEILKEPDTIQSYINPNIKIPRRIAVEEISFAAHVDFQQNSEFIDKVGALTIILVHGDSVPMGRLKSALLSKYLARKGTNKEIKIYNPKNCEVVKVKTEVVKFAKVLGSLAEKHLLLLKEKVQKKIDQTEDPSSTEKKSHTDIEKSDLLEQEHSESEILTVIDLNHVVSGVLVSKDFDLNLLQMQDLHEFTQLSTSILKSRINLKICSDFFLVNWHLEQMFGNINVLCCNETVWECVIMDIISILINKLDDSTLNITIEWINDNLLSDSLADSIIAIMYSIDSSPASVKLSSTNCLHSDSNKMKKDEIDPDIEKKINPSINNNLKYDSNTKRRVLCISSLLLSQFGNALTPIDDENATIVIGKTEAKINYITSEVNCNSKVLKNRIENIIKRACTLAAPLCLLEKNINLT